MQLAIALYPGFTALDAIGPYQVLTQIPGTDTVLVAEQRGRLSDEAALLHLEIEHTFDEVATPDVLLVPGGLVTRRIAVDGSPIVEWVRSAHETTTYTTSVCTGALVLGAAGLLDGLPATTHWCAYDHLRGHGAEATAAGVSAGIDLALTLVGRMYGDEVAQAIQLGIEYDPQPPYDSGAPSKAPDEIRELVTGIVRDAEASLVD
jgi:transcriptional regulator GlxA family with amidase domain